MFDLEKSIAEWRKQMQSAGIEASVPLEELEVHLREDVDRLVQSGLGRESAFGIAARHLGQPQILKTEFKKNQGNSNKWFGLFAVLFGVVIILRILTESDAVAHPGGKRGWLLLGTLAIAFGLSTPIFNYRLGAVREVRLWKLVGITYSLIAVWISVLPILSFLTVPKLSSAFSLADRFLAFAALATSILSIQCWRLGRKLVPVIHAKLARTVVGIVCCLLGPGAMALFLYCLVPQWIQSPAPQFDILATWAWTLMAILGGVGYGLAEAARENQPLSHEHYV